MLFKKTYIPNLNLVIFVLCGLLSAVYGCFFSNPSTILKYYNDYIFYFLSISLFLFLLSVVRFIAKNNESNLTDTIRQFCWLFLKKHWIALFCSIFIVLLGFFIVKPDVRILANEIDAISVSQQFYDSKKCFVDLSSLKYISGQKEFFKTNYYNKPVLFPYLVSLIHSISGYRISNFFVLNIILGFFSLFLIYYLIQSYYGRFWGLIGLFLSSTFPLFLLYVNSSNLDIFYLFCFLILLLFFINFLKDRTIFKAEMLLLWLLLLLHIKLEALIAVIIILPVIVFILPSNEYRKFSFFLAVFPLLLLPIFWECRTINYDFLKSITEKNIYDNYQQVLLNLKNILDYFFSGNELYGYANVITYLGLLGFISLIFDSLRIKISKIGKEIAKSEKLLLGFFIGYHFLLLFYYTAICNVDLRIVTNGSLGIIFIPLFVFLSIHFIYKLQKKILFPRLYYVLFVIALISFYWSCLGNEFGIRSFHYSWSYKISRDYLQQNYSDKKDFIIIARSANCYTPLGYNAINHEVYENNKERVIKLLKDKHFSFCILMQVIIDHNGEQFADSKIPEELDSKIIYEKRINQDFMIRMHYCLAR